MARHGPSMPSLRCATSSSRPAWFGCCCLAGGGLLIPLEALAALPVLSRPHGPELLPIASDDDRRRVRLITAVLFLAYFIPLLIEVAGR